MKPGIENVLRNVLGPRVERLFAGAPGALDQIRFEVPEHFAVLSERRGPRERSIVVALEIRR
jgi:hypothetical protein